MQTLSICCASFGKYWPTSTPSARVAIASTGPCVALPGFGSNVSTWLMPPRRNRKITCLHDARPSTSGPCGSCSSAPATARGPNVAAAVTPSIDCAMPVRNVRRVGMSLPRISCLKLMVVPRGSPHEAELVAVAQDPHEVLDDAFAVDRDRLAPLLRLGVRRLAAERRQERDAHAARAVGRGLERRAQRRLPFEH